MAKIASSLILLASVIQSSLAAPIADDLKIVKSIIHNGQQIDWVLPESQGKIAAAPPLPPHVAKPDNIEEISFVFPPKGPAGTVPIARANIQSPPKRLPQASDHWNASSSLKEKRQNAGTHWYASSNQNVNNHGGGAQLNIWPMYTEQNADFSLLQVAVVRNNVPNNKGSQTVEAGYQHYENLVSGGPYLFTYFTTVGYKSSGDNVGGYNRLQKGWVQVDSNIYPGIHFSPNSAYGGTQYEFTFQYYLYQGNWWLLVGTTWIGYYPASLFSAGTTASASLADHSDTILFYGEVVNSEAALTKTDMGSGNFPGKGFGQAAYLRNIQVIDVNNYLNNYTADGYVISDTKRYNLEQHWNSGSNYGSYMYLGGPGAGGVVNG